MGSRNKGTQGETPQERAMAEVGMQRIADYNTRWRPVHQRMAQAIQSMGMPDSDERQRVTGKAVSSAERAFGGAEEKAEAGMMSRGVGSGSSKFKLAQTGLAADKGAARGLTLEAGEQAVDDAWAQGLVNLMGIGRGQAATAMRGMGQSAQIAARGAESEAQRSALNRAGNMNTLGTIAGMGYQAMAGGLKVPTIGSGEAMGTGAAPGEAVGSFTGRF